MGNFNKYEAYQQHRADSVLALIADLSSYLCKHFLLELAPSLDIFLPGSKYASAFKRNVIKLFSRLVLNIGLCVYECR